jgi:hypothetical protein
MGQADESACGSAMPAEPAPRGARIIPRRRLGLAPLVGDHGKFPALVVGTYCVAPSNWRIASMSTGSTSGATLLAPGLVS